MPQLDGLRAIAVLAVIAQHTTRFSASTGFSLGTAGVWLFYVLSGFLITGILLRCREKVKTQRFGRLKAWRAFWMRRALRIFPLYYVALCACCCSGYRSRERGVAVVRDLPAKRAYRHAGQVADRARAFLVIGSGGAVLRDLACGMPPSPPVSHSATGSNGCGGGTALAIRSHPCDVEHGLVRGFAACLPGWLGSGRDTGDHATDSAALGTQMRYLAGDDCGRAQVSRDGVVAQFYTRTIRVLAHRVVDCRPRCKRIQRTVRSATIVCPSRVFGQDQLRDLCDPRRASNRHRENWPSPGHLFRVSD